MKNRHSELFCEKTLAIDYLYREKVDDDMNSTVEFIVGLVRYETI